MKQPVQNEQTAEISKRAAKERTRYLAALRRLSGNPDFQRVFRALRASVGLPVAGANARPVFIPGPDGSICPFVTHTRAGRQSVALELESHLLEANAITEAPDTGDSLDDAEEGE